MLHSDWDATYDVAVKIGGCMTLTASVVGVFWILISVTNLTMYELDIVRSIRL